MIASKVGRLSASQRPTSCLGSGSPRRDYQTIAGQLVRSEVRRPRTRQSIDIVGASVRLCVWA
jgi:hypothetical protein